MYIESTWNPKNNTGIHEIDSQHQYLLSLINTIGLELSNGTNHTYIYDLFQELSSYAQFHFISEENILYRKGYPEIKQLRTSHNDLIEIFTFLVSNFNLPQVELAVKSTLTFLSESLETHLLDDQHCINHPPSSFFQ